MIDFPRNLNALLDETAARVPGRAILATASRSVTAAELQTQALKAAAAFYGRGIRKGHRVAVCLRNGPEFIVAYFGLMRLGAVAVPINFMIQKASELEYMFKDSEAAGIVTQKEFLPGILEARKSLPAFRSVWSIDSADPGQGVESFEAFLAGADPKGLPAADVAGNEIASILYTSGTTGNPKGVMLSHDNLASNTEASIRFFNLGEKDVMLCILPMFHTFAWTTCVLLPLRCGMKAVIMPNITPPKPWLSLMARHGVTLFVAVPPIFSVLAREARGLKGLVLRYWFFRTVRFCISGAAPLSVDVMAAFEKAMGAPIMEGYGLTETSPVVSANPPGRQRPGSVGVTLPDVQVRIIDDNEQPLPAGQEGEICIQGPNVMQGYLNKPEDTRETLTKDGWLKTGDMGLVDSDGYLFIRGRKKDMIIIKGLKVFPPQVEQVISAHPSVEEVAVVGIPDPDGDETIKAFVVLKPGVPAGKDAKASLMQFFREKLDAYKRPRDVEFMESLPKNTLQKVLKRVLRQKEIEKRS